MAVSEAAQLILGPTTDDSYQDHGAQQQPNNIATYIKRNHQVYGGAFLAWVTRCISFLGPIQDILIFADTEHNKILNLSQSLYHGGHMAGAIRWHVCNILDKASHFMSFKMDSAASLSSGCQKTSERKSPRFCGQNNSLVLIIIN
jgi:hypothetical protein